jgi:hypothetical protein
MCGDGGAVSSAAPALKCLRVERPSAAYPFEPGSSPAPPQPSSRGTPGPTLGVVRADKHLPSLPTESKSGIPGRLLQLV